MEKISFYIMNTLMMNNIIIVVFGKTILYFFGLALGDVPKLDEWRDSCRKMFTELQPNPILYKFFKKFLIAYN